jgi:pyrroloquinoline quinone (PQQ) biosynthesis protein C
MLRGTVPFLRTETGGASFVVDTLALDPARAPVAATLTLLGRGLDISSAAASLPGEVAEELVREQLEACLDHVFSHSFWSELRGGRGRAGLLAFLLETRQYLAAAASRMSSGVAFAPADSPGVRLLAEHVVEEADHDRFFEDALAEIGCSRDIVRAARPLPTTVEWIYLMRALGSTGPLASAIASGVLESSAVDRDTVRGWHRMLVERSFLPAGAVEAMLGHVAVDDELGHGANWTTYIAGQAPLLTRELAVALNGAAAVAEMIYRWLTTLAEGLSGDLVDRLASPTDGTNAGGARRDATFSGTPVWPAPVLDRLTRGPRQGGDVDVIVGSSYHLGWAPWPHLTEAVSAVTDLSADGLGNATADLAGHIRTWLRSVDGHRLWADMAVADGPGLAEGWLLENSHYLASSPLHVSAAIFACPEPEVRRHLLEHLREEAGHAEILRQALVGHLPVPVERCRPLPTTLALTGYLRELALTDWRAYCLAIAYLQFSYDRADDRHAGFYQAVTARRESARELMAAMQHHDGIDGDLDHPAKLQDLIEQVSRGGMPADSIARASLVAQLAWGFLDGIWDHYRHGPVALAQRLGWS